MNSHSLWNRFTHFGLVFAGLIFANAATASPASGDLFYTLFSGSPNVWKVGFTYDGTTALLGAPTPIASAPGADGIVFAPNGHLLIGGQGAQRVFEFTTAGAFVSSGSAQGNSFHLALDPSGAKVWTSDFGGDLADLPLGPVANAGPLHDVTGSDPGLTQLAFAPNGKVFYVNGNPNGFGNIGFIDMTTFVTSRFATGVQPAHGMVYDNFTGLMTLFGAGDVGTFDPTSATPATTLKQFATGVCDFDQGAVDGKGHALVAGCGGITFLDYSVSGDITAPNYLHFFGGFGAIDDVAPLSGLGSTPVPEPSSALLITIGLASGMLFAKRRRGAARQ